ncbi:MAG: FAD-dependent monooxygenase [Proteobacteria bacterium]|nr:FAD-dependent monooxygenase [Pseudomonadota bacterium]
MHVTQGRDHAAAVVIVGAGSVGLLLGCCLSRLGVAYRILERAAAPSAHSRAIGLHPVALELLDRLQLAAPFLRAGCRVDGGRALRSDGRLAGRLSFASCPPPFPFVLTLPQQQTESLLERALVERDPRALTRSAEVVRVEPLQDAVRVTYLDDQHDSKVLEAAVVVGCDGKHSMVRRAAGIPFDGAAYPDAFIMGDLDDDTGLGAEAVIFLHHEGMVESFPLPMGRRRWVARTDCPRQRATREELQAIVKRRCGVRLEQSQEHMLSAFGIERFLARTLVAGRIALAGDAAHVLSPIGGQGMSVGWQDAWHLAQTLQRTLRGDASSARLWRDYDRQRRRAALWASRRAEAFTRLGRPQRWPAARDALVRLALAWPLRATAARIFTMRGSSRPAALPAPS